MPVVRTYGGRAVAQRPLADTAQRVPTDPNQFGAGFGETLAKSALGLASTVQRVQEEERGKADQIAVLAAENKLAEWERQRLYDPQAGAFAVRGKDALALPDTIKADYDKTAGDIEAALTGDRQKQAFARARMSRWQNVDLSIRRHVFQEQQSYDEQETKAFVEQAQSHAIANALDPRRVSDELNRAVAAVRDHATRNGIGPEQAAQQIARVQTSVHTGVIDSLLTAEKDQAARAYFEEARGQIDGDAITRIEKALQEGTQRRMSQEATDAIMRDSSSLTDSLERARAIDDPALRDAVQQRVEHEWAIRKQVARENEENVMVTAANLIDTGGIKAVPPSLWSQLEPGQRTTLESYAKRHLQGGDGESNLAVYYQLMSNASSDPESFKNLNLLNYINRLSKSDFKQLVGVQASIRKGDVVKAAEDLSGFRTNDQIVNDALDINGIKREGKDSNPEAVARVRKMVDEQVGLFQQSAGRKATNEDVRQIVDGLMSKAVAQPQSWYWSLLGYKPTEKRLVETSLADIPSATQKQIRDSLQRHGVPATDANVIQTYVDSQMRSKK